MAWIPERKRDTAARKQHDAWRGSASERGYDHQWSKLSKAKLAANPVCEMCCHTLASLVDHIRPVRSRPDLRLCWENLQSLCRSCHAIKTAREG